MDVDSFVLSRWRGRRCRCGPYESTHQAIHRVLRFSSMWLKNNYGTRPVKLTTITSKYIFQNYTQWAKNEIRGLIKRRKIKNATEAKHTSSGRLLRAERTNNTEKQNQRKPDNLGSSVKSISEKTCYQVCRVPLRPVIGRRGERGRIATPFR